MVRESVKAPLYPSDPPRVKRTHAANQMKRVQRGGSAASTFDSLAQVWGRPQCGFHIQPPTDSPRKARQSQCVHAKTHSAAPPTPFSRSPRPPVPRRDRRQKTRNPEMNQPSLIAAPTIENARPAIPTHGGMGTQHTASRPVWRSRGKQQAGSNEKQSERTAKKA